MSPLTLVLALSALLLEAAAAFAGEAASESIRDFMIQNVCLDASEAVVEGVSPADGDPHCVRQRDLRPGENLPYHKHDHPGAAAASAPLGYQRHDSFPVATALFGIAVEHSFDFGGGDGRRFGVFDAAQGDGGDITVLSPKTVSFAATEDGGAGFQLFVGPDCHEGVDAAAITGSWILALLVPGGPLQGEIVARLNVLKEGRQLQCPARFNAAFTRWHLQPVSYRAARGQGAPITLITLVSEHYGGEHPGSADHVERFYFTRELGSTRWERWQNFEHSRDFSASRLTKAAGDLASTGRCSQTEAPAGGATFVMIDCREWTRIVPPERSGGDDPGFFIKTVRSRNLAAGLFAAPAD